MRPTRRSMAPMGSRCRGLTLTEALIAMVIVGIVMTLAVPAFNDLIVRERVRGINAELVADLSFARSESHQRSVQVMIDFRSDSSVSCYSIYTSIAGGQCNCLQGSNACDNGGMATNLLLKLVQIPRDRGISAGVDGNVVRIEQPQGLLNMPTLVVPVTSQRGPSLVTTMTRTGQISTCSPGSSISGVPACAP